MQNHLSKDEIQRTELEQFAQELKKAGFTVMVSAKHPFKWLFFALGDNIGEVSAGNFFGFNFGTVHKPCRECGTGFQIGEREGPLTIGTAKEAALTFAPNWAGSNDRAAVVKYSSVQEFINHSSNKWAEYYTL